MNFYVEIYSTFMLKFFYVEIYRTFMLKFIELEIGYFVEFFIELMFKLF